MTDRKKWERSRSTYRNNRNNWQPAYEQPPRRRLRFAMRSPQGRRERATLHVLYYSIYLTTGPFQHSRLIMRGQTPLSREWRSIRGEHASLHADSFDWKKSTRATCCNVFFDVSVMVMVMSIETKWRETILFKIFAKIVTQIYWWSKSRI